jgi:hypothetical protein
MCRISINCAAHVGRPLEQNTDASAVTGQGVSTTFTCRWRIASHVDGQGVKIKRGARYISRACLAS